MTWSVPTPALEAVRFTLHLPTQRNGRKTTLEAQGTSGNKRSSLWAYSEEWTAAQHDQGLQPCDTLHWLSLIAWQDRPNTPFLLDRATRGLPVWEQGELPLGM